MKKQLTRKQLQNDFDAMRKHRDEAESRYLRLVDEVNSFRLQVQQLITERDDWRFAFKAIANANAASSR